MEQPILTRKEEHVATITINRPEAMNALTLKIEKVLLEVFKEIALDEDVRVIVLEGAGGNFSVGGDLAEIGGTLGAPEWLDQLKNVSFKLIQSMREMPQPVICKVRGNAVGYGMSISLAGDFVISSHNARFCQPFVNIGLTIDGCASYILPRLVGMTRARQLALLGEVINGIEAAEMGLIYKAVPDEELDEEVALLACTLAKKPSRLALATTKEALEGSFERSLHETVKWEAAHQAVILQNTDFKEIARRMLNKKA